MKSIEPDIPGWRHPRFYDKMVGVINRWNAGIFKSPLKRLLMLTAVAACATVARAQTNGIFADFTTTMGSFTCQLEYTRTPKTVANFIGLATGQRPWLDLTTGTVRQDPFYSGTTFHRVIAGFMIQGGSPNGQGTDGPGYIFVDEFSSLLNFKNPWVLAMANSGLDSNGSQFFVTVAPYTSGNNNYTIFGHVTSGTNVVSAINQVTTDPSNNKPLTNVVIQSVTIRRVGSTAEAFDIDAQNLPVVTNLPLQIGSGSNQVSLTFINRLYSENWLFSTTNLDNWSWESLGVEVATPLTNTIPKTNNLPANFFRLTQVQYVSTFAPMNAFGRTFILTFPSGAGKLSLKFDSQGGGTYGFTGSPSETGTITSYTWDQKPYSGFIWPIYYSGKLAPMTLQLVYQSATNGSFHGTVYSSSQPTITGPFTTSGP
jgi:peptidyl-prolyl cis-trans isomerase A (cyclophilin A)